MPSPNIEMEYLFSRPIPASTPNQSHKLLISCLNDSNHDGGATHPQQRFEVVGAKQVAVNNEDRGNCNRQS